MNHENSVVEMGGPFSALFTPFDDSNQINLEMLDKLVAFQIENGIQGFFVAGTTGEGFLLSSCERTAVIKQVVESCGTQGQVIAHVGHPSTEKSVELARQAADVGANWIASMPPLFYGKTFNGTYRHYEAIAKATDLPFMIYAMGTEIDGERDQAFFEIPNVCGLKYTGANFFSVQQLVRLLGRPVALMSGFDEQFVAGQSFGFNGGIGSTYNFAPDYYANIFRLYHSGDIHEASRLQAEINVLTHLMVSYENWSYRKAIMKYIGYDCGSARLPFAPLTEAEYTEFAAKLDAMGVLKRCD